MTDNLDIRIQSIDSLQGLEPLWSELETRAPCSFFCSWGWIGTWLASLPHNVSPSLVQIFAAERLIGLAVICRNSIRYPLFKSDGLFVHETGSLDFDRLTIEYNNLVIEPEFEASLPRVFAAFRKHFDWHEVRVSGIDTRLLPAFRHAAEENNLECVIRDTKPCNSVELQGLREANSDYLSALSRNTRYQVRRSIREYEKRGALQLTVAHDLATAGEFMEQLRRLHQDYWTARGQPGAFSTVWVRGFHDTLVKERFPHGEIQLMRVTCGDEPIAYLYNFVYRDKIYCYQSGLVYENNSHLKPGLVAHALAIQHNLDDGLNSYDFLMGNERYKKNLGNTLTEMYWLSLRRPLLRYRIHDSLAAMKNRLRRQPDSND